MESTLQTAVPESPANASQPARTAHMIKRSPALAVVLSMLPGLGHLYLGLYRRGVVFFAAWALSLGLSHSHNSTLGIVIPFIWFFTLIDAFRCAQAINLGQATAGVPRELARHVALRASNLGFGVLLVLGGAVLLYNQFYPLDLYFLEDWWPLAIVLFGVYVIARHFWEERERRAVGELAGSA